MAIAMLAMAVAAAAPCKDAEVANARGLDQWKRGERAEARATWETATNAGVACPAVAAELCTNVGYALLEDGQLLAAWHQLEFCGDGPTTLLNLGDTFARLGWTDDARDAYTRALANGLVGTQAARATRAIAGLGASLAAGPPVVCTEVSGAAGDVLAACNGRRWRTRDEGRSWVAEDGVPSVAAAPIALPPGADHLLGVDDWWFAIANVPGSDDEHAAAGVLLRSDDQGATWTLVRRFEAAYYTAALALGGDRGLLLVGGVARQGLGGSDWLERSIDGGAKWTPPVKDPTSADATDSCAWTGAWGAGDRAAVVGDRPACGPQYSVDRGATFHFARAAPKGMVEGASTLWGSGGLVYAAGPGGLFASVDGGATWVDRTPR